MHMTNFMSSFPIIQPHTLILFFQRPYSRSQSGSKAACWRLLDKYIQHISTTVPFWGLQDVWYRPGEWVRGIRCIHTVQSSLCRQWECGDTFLGK
jgi:hypothetical protein